MTEGTTPKVRVLVVHKDATAERNLAELIANIPGYQGFAAQLNVQSGGDGLSQELRKKVVATQAHFVLIDQSCIGKELSLRHLQHDLLSVQCVLHVGDMVETEQAMNAFLDGVWLARVASSPSLSTTLSTTAFGPSLERALRGARAVSQTIHGVSHLEGAAETIEASLDEIRELMAYLYPDASQLTIQPLRRDASYTSATRGRTALLMVSADGKVEQVLKLGRSDKIRQETENFQKYVDGRVVGMRHAVLVRSKALWNVGGIVYSLIGSGEGVPPSFSSYFRNNDTVQIKKVLEKLFSSWKRHYGTQTETYEPLFVQYNRVWFQKLGDRLERLIENPPKLPSDYSFLPHPVAWVLNHQERSVAQRMHGAITHGDLHAENLLVDEDGNCWLIDFERTGPGPRLQDFVELEHDIVTRLTDVPLDEFFRLCVRLAEPPKPTVSLADNAQKYQLLSPIAEKTIDVLIKLHGDCLSTLGSSKYEDSRERLWGILFNAVYVLSLSVDPSRLNRLLILGGVICRRLEEWHNWSQPPEWPPKEWMPMLSPRAKIYSAPSPRLKFQLTDLKNDQQQFKVAVLDRPNQEPHAISQLPYQGDSLVAVMKLLELGGYQPDAFSPAQTAALEQLGLLQENRLIHDWCDRVGDRLFKALVPAEGGVQTAFANVFHTDRKGGELQIIFDEDAADLACQPWEMIHDGFPKKPRTQIDVVRYIASDWKAQALEVPQAPCQILYVTARPDGYTKPALDRNAIKDSVARSAPPQRFRFNELPERTHNALKQRLLDTATAPVHILHFDGHGTFARLCPTCGAEHFAHESMCAKCGAPLDNAHAPARGYLLFEDDQGKVKFVDTTKFLEGVQRSEVRLVVLSSCHSARVRGADLLLAGVGPGLILAGVPAVVAMQFSISDQDAIKFNQEFYKALAQGDSLPSAVYRARTMLKEPARWSPVLYLRSKDHQIHLCPPK